MEAIVVLASRSHGIGNGLSYACGPDIRPGMLVRVPLRHSQVEGVVMDVRGQAEHGFALKPVSAAVHAAPLLPEPLLKTALWMARYYCCTLRHALQVILPPPPWSLLPPVSSTWYALSANAPTPRGKRQLLVHEYLRGKDAVSAYELQSETGATSAVLRGMADKGMLAASQRMETVAVPPAPRPKTSELNDAERKTLTAVQADDRPSLIIDAGGIDRVRLFASLIAAAVRDGKAAVLLEPEVVSAQRMAKRLEAELGMPVTLVHGAQSPSEQRRTWRLLSAPHPHVVVGTRTALFSPLSGLGLVVIDDEHEWTYKSEQAPRYHARHAAEVLCKSADAKLVLCSATPSLESWRHAVGQNPRFSLVHADPPEGTRAQVRVVDLVQEAAGKNYPLSAPLIGALQKRLDAGQQSVLLINRRGSATGLLCLDCRTILSSGKTSLPLSVHVIGGKPFLVDGHAGETLPVPETCPRCGSARLHGVGAGTQRVEQTLKRLFPKARVARVDRDTLEEETIGSVLKRAEQGDIDILVGTQPVVKAAELPNVTLGAVLVADIGLSLPHFRAGERVVQQVGGLLRRVRGGAGSDVLIQTFRPEAPEIALSSRRAMPEYLDAELQLRAAAGYPPVTQMIRLIVREGGEAKARQLVQAADAADKKACTVWAAAPLPGKRGGKWSVFLKGASPRTALQSLDLRGVSIDVDPIDWE